MAKFASPTRVPAVPVIETKKAAVARATAPHPAALMPPKPGKTPHDQHAELAHRGKQHGF